MERKQGVVMMVVEMSKLKVKNVVFQIGVVINGLIQIRNVGRELVLIEMINVTLI